MRKIHKAWLIGAETCIGQAILNQIDPRVINIMPTDIDDIDVLNIDEALAYSYLNQPDAIINCYDLNDVNECEMDPIKAYKINSLIPRNLAVCSRRIGARLVHISTDNVFGEERNVPYNEFDSPNPINIYGNSKLQGENYIRELSQKYFIVRTGYVYGEKNGIKINSSKFSRYISPTSSKELASFIIKLMNTPEYGVYHASSTGYCSYETFIKKFSELSGATINSIENSMDSELIKNIQLDQFMLKLSDLYKFPSWETDLEQFCKTIK